MGPADDYNRGREQTSKPRLLWVDPNAAPGRSSGPVQRHTNGRSRGGTTGGSTGRAGRSSGRGASGGGGRGRGGRTAGSLGSGAAGRPGASPVSIRRRGPAGPAPASSDSSANPKAKLAEHRLSRGGKGAGIGKPEPPAPGQAKPKHGRIKLLDEALVFNDGSEAVLVSPNLLPRLSPWSGKLSFRA